MNQGLDSVGQLISRLSGNFTRIGAFNFLDAGVAGQRGNRRSRQGSAHVCPMFSAGNAGRHQPGVFFFSADAAGYRITAGNDFSGVTSK